MPNAKPRGGGSIRSAGRTVVPMRVFEGVYAAIVAGPLLALVVATVLALAHGHGDWLLLAVPLGRRLGLLLRSLGLCASVAVIDVVAGVLVVCAFWRWHRRWGWVRWLPLVLVVVPPYIQALAWRDVLGQITLRLGLAQPAGLGVSIWVLAMALLPVGLGVALVSLETVARPLVDAARTQQDDTTVLRRVVLPLAGPVLAAGSLLVFLLSLMDYTVPSLFGVNVYTLEIFAEFSASAEPVRAFLLAVPLLGVVAGGAVAGRRLVRHVGQLPDWGVSPWRTPPVWRPSFALGQRAAVGILGAQVLVPLVVLVRLTIRGGGWVQALQAAAGEISFSLAVAAATALLSLPLSGLVLAVVVRARRLPDLAGWVAFLPAAMPAPLVGIGLVTLWNRPVLGGVYGTAAMPVLAALARFAPLAALVLLAQYRRVDPLVWDAVRVFRKRGWQAVWRVWLPLLGPGVVAGASLVFALTLGELGATLVVVPPGRSTLTLRIYNYLHYGASDVVAGLCLAMVVLTLAAGMLGACGFAAKSQRAAPGEVR